MANLIYPTNGLLRWTLYGVSSTGINYHLRTNYWIVELEDLISNYVECSLPSYLAINVSQANFSQSSTAGGDLIVSAPAIAFSCTSGTATVYGYYFTDSTNTYLMGSLTFDTSLTLQPASPVIVQPVLNTYSEFASS